MVYKFFGGNEKIFNESNTACFAQTSKQQKYISANTFLMTVYLQGASKQHRLLLTIVDTGIGIIYILLVCFDVFDDA